ncbi:autophagy protein Apg17-domain-containing protein [Flammula alnicola]|nr:autophagy protein Apg17-domain-containing protein [Flammula alnicola]
MSGPGTSPMSSSNPHLGQPLRATTGTTTNPMNQPHLVSLVLQSKKALQHGEHLCTLAHSASHASAQAAVDVLALDAKLRWVVEAVVEQLKLAANVAKAIEEKRAHLGKQLYEWDTIRAKRTDALDDILELLGAQLVPPDFHQTSADSSLFGSQHPSDIEQDESAPSRTYTGKTTASPSTSPKRNLTHSNGSGKASGTTSSSYGRPSMSPVSPSATLRRNSTVRRYGDNPAELKAKEQDNRKGGKNRKEDRKRWKTLRDFVDDQAIEDALEMIESDRSALDKILSKTDGYPETLTRTIHAIQASLPYPDTGDPTTLATTQTVITAQEARVNVMASVLENLASHYDGMASALKETENGEVFSEEDWQIMNRDTEELPVIMAELEESANTIEGYHGQLTTTKDNLEKDLEHLGTVLDDLDELGDIMGEMLTTQESVEAQAEEELNALHHHLTTLEQLHEQYVAYRMAFNKLLLEIARRRQYREAAENIVRGMMRQLESMTEEESRVRTHFNAEYGQHLPEDLCLCIGNAPTVWEVVPAEGTTLESLPFIDNDLIVEARDKVGYGEGPPGAESL